MVMNVKTNQAAVDEEGRPLLSPNLNEANTLHRVQSGKPSFGKSALFWTMFKRGKTQYKNVRQ